MSGILNRDLIVPSRRAHRLTPARPPCQIHRHVRARAVAFADERARAARSVAGEEVDVRAAKAPAVAGDEQAVVDRAVGELRPLELRDVDRRAEPDEARIDGHGAIRNQRAAGAADAPALPGDAEAALAVDAAQEVHRAPVAQHARALLDQVALEALRR